MIINLKNECEKASIKEYFYGAKINKAIKDVYLGLGYLEPNEKNRKEGPSKGHEELLFILDGQIKMKFKDKEVILNEGEIIHLPEKTNVKLENLTDKKIFFIIAGGHIKKHSH